jgi:hypothetical protein
MTYDKCLESKWLARINKSASRAIVYGSRPTKGCRMPDKEFECSSCQAHADECVRLAGLTDDLTVRDQLLDLAQEWILAAQRARRPSDYARVVPLKKNQNDNVVPLHRNPDDHDDSFIASKRSPCLAHPGER